MTLASVRPSPGRGGLAHGKGEPAAGRRSLGGRAGVLWADPEIPNSRSPDSRFGRETGRKVYPRSPIRPRKGIGVPGAAGPAGDSISWPGCGYYRALISGPLSKCAARRGCQCAAACTTGRSLLGAGPDRGAANPKDAAAASAKLERGTGTVLPRRVRQLRARGYLQSSFNPSQSASPDLEYPWW
jgi:hypothetical protein